MLTAIHPKLPMRDKAMTRAYYIDKLGFTDVGAADYPDYLILQKDGVELHFFTYADLDPLMNYGQVYIRTDDVDGFYASLIKLGAFIHPDVPLRDTPWGQREFSVLDPDNNLLTFGQAQ